MKFAILRTQKLKDKNSIRRSLKHAFREQETPNADVSLMLENTHLGAKSAQEAMDGINHRLPDKVRKNGVLAVEYLMTASPEVMQGKSRTEQDQYFTDCLEWLNKRHGAENVVYAGIHRDETTPHMYAYVVPIDDKGKLNCRAFLGGAKALNQMQTDFAKNVGYPHGLERGIEGSKAKHTRIKDFYRNLEQPNVDMIKLNEQLNDKPLPETRMLESKADYALRAVNRAVKKIEPHIKAMEDQTRDAEHYKQMYAILKNESEEKQELVKHWHNKAEKAVKEQQAMFRGLSEEDKEQVKAHIEQLRVQRQLERKERQKSRQKEQKGLER
ncbi:hypothetical protein J7I01_004843 [Vibrio parahaemolyticus]|nr:hypothetical protein [Vibrio parahaemolyticus]